MIKEDFNSRLITSIFTIFIFIISVTFFMKKQIYLVLYAIFIYVIYIIFLYFESRKIYKVKNYIKALVVITIMIDIVAGFYFNFYHTTNWFDKAMHMFGCFSFTLLFHSMIHLYIKNFSDFKIVIFIFITSLGVTSGVFYEFIEFGLDVILKSKNQNGLIDTNLDLLFDTLGSMLATIFIIYRKSSY
ncbi:hypothetical protein [Marinisporobacter balticus]|nr:hypothetical protein [Marinisporobacter balticus]